MGYCRACKGEHKPIRKIDSSYLAANYWPNRFVTRHPEVFASFADWFRRCLPEQTKDLTNDQLLDWFNRARGAETDLLHGYTDPAGLFLSTPAKYLVLRDMQMACTGEILTTVCADEETPSAVSIMNVSDDGSAAVASWVISPATAASLRDILKDKIGEPDSEGLTDAETIQKIHDGPGQDIVHMERGCDCGGD